MTTTVIGIDCSTEERKVGLALGHVDVSNASIERVEVCSKIRPPVEIVSGWISNVSRKDPILLALDAPLGWPIDLGRVLIDHGAGCPIPAEVGKDALFRRRTDDFVRRKTGKRSLDVAADRIGRTAYSALKLLQDLRQRTMLPIQLAWNLPLGYPVSAIEVYPAGTLAAYGVKNDKVLQVLASQLKGDIQSPAKRVIEDNEHARDAAICFMAGIDFLLGNAIPPTAEQFETARKEGWIWVRDPGRPSQKKPGTKSY